jgi:lipoprotein NlpI
MRGTLLHEVQAHKLALMDLGKAIAINPSQPANFYLRGDCHLKLGNYEQALQDFNSAEMKGFQDYCALTLSRGTVKRLLRRYDAAIQDFQLTYDNLDPSDRVNNIIFIFPVVFLFYFNFVDWKNSSSVFHCLLLHRYPAV